ncbi:hypothetical protein [Psychrobacillus sp. L3]|uniref:hypothetical protein n=1 Tax=Psychrobacillus sp. L3 TaxID=3236891 RepID=UPI0036F2D992
MSLFSIVFGIVYILFLTGAVRKAERAAFAMEVRGFTGEPRNSYFHTISIGKVDLVLGALFLFVLVLSFTNQLWLG